MCFPAASPPGSTQPRNSRADTFSRRAGFLAATWFITAASHAALPVYDIGNPTDEEQLYLELINRARADPAEEGVRLAFSLDPDVAGARTYFGVNLDVLVDEFASLSPAPPLAPSARLTDAARRHSADMLANAFQGHVGSDGSTLGIRASAAGYLYTSLGENVFSYARGVFHGHAGFEIDWGAGTDGMQIGRGHRINIHKPLFREAGIGVVLGSKTLNGSTVGPHLVTQDFGTSFNSTAFVTGIAFLDINANQAYDLGEGLGGVRVDVAGSTHGALTSKSGGYAVPVPLAPASRAVTFAGPGIKRAATAAIIDGQNVKLDLALPYTPPSVSGSSLIGLGVATTYSISAIPGATGYEWQALRHAATATPTDTAEATGRVNATLSAGYDLISTTVRAEGAGSYHLAHPRPVDQLLTYPVSYYVRPSPVLRFKSRLALATPDQNAVVEISTDEGGTWTEIYRQAGDNIGETGFTARSIALDAYQGKTIRLRFAYRAKGGYYSQSSGSVGWFIDTVEFVNLPTVSEATAPAAASVNRILVFTPSLLQSHLLRARALVPGRTLPFGPLLSVAVAPSPLPVFPTALTGKFEGLFVAPSGTPLPVGSLQVTVASTGAFTARLAHGGPAAIALSGQLTLDPTKTFATLSTLNAGDYTLRSVKISTAAGTNLTALLRKSSSSTDVGTLTDGVKLKAYNITAPSPWAGAYTASFAVTGNLDPATTDRAAPSGAGYATGSVNAAGTLALTGKLADGKAFTGSFSSDSSAGYRIFVQPHGTPGNYFGGWLKLTQWATTPSPRYRVAAVTDQEFYWNKPAKTGDTSYPAGFGPLALKVDMATYLPPTATLTLSRQLGLTTTQANALPLRATGAGLTSTQATAIAGTARLSTANALTVNTTAKAALWPGLLLNPATGLITGSIKVQDTTSSFRTAPWSGVVVQLPPAERAKLLAQGFFVLAPKTTGTSLAGGVLLAEP